MSLGKTCKHTSNIGPGLPTFSLSCPSSRCLTPLAVAFLVESFSTSSSLLLMRSSKNLTTFSELVVPAVAVYHSQMMAKKGTALGVRILRMLSNVYHTVYC